MDAGNLRLAEGLVQRAYLRQATEAKNSRVGLIRILLSQRRMPENGWDDEMIEFFLGELTAMDSNNFHENIGGGEREGRVFSTLVRRRHYGMSHGIGRSGDISEVQPKAAGSSLAVAITRYLVRDLLCVAGATRTASAFVFPVATGMALVLCLLTIRQSRPLAKYVIWPRMDQKSGLKAILTAGFQPLVIENEILGDEVMTDCPAVAAAIKSIGAENVVCIFCTTSCFAPRAPDKVVELSLLAKENDIPLLVNNAYGVQSSKTMHELNEAMRLGRLDLYVQSTDKNLMVPVGGAIVAGPDTFTTVAMVCQTYPGRASGSQTLDVLITLLGMGRVGFKALLHTRKEVFAWLTQQLRDLAQKHGQQILITPHNQISIGITVGSHEATGQQVTSLGAMLFSRGVSGTRVVSGTEMKSVGPLTFEGYGAHVASYPRAYLTVAAAIGMTMAEANTLLNRLDSTLHQFQKERSPENRC